MHNHSRNLSTFKRLTLYTLLSAAPGFALAQSTLEEIVVTARKSSESLQTTPVAVTAMTEGMLVDKGILKMDDLQRTAPSLTIGTGGTGPASIIYTSIRGQAQNSPNSVTDAAVGVYIDGVYLGRPIGSNLGFLDVAQVEVLRGPQGTLFGRNTTGGALTITTNKPTSEFEGRVKGEIGNYGFHNIEAVVNVPVTDELATRFAYRYNERDGYYDNPFYSEGFKDVDESYSARGSVLYTPSEGNYEVYFSMDHEYYKDNGTPTTVVAFNDNARAAPSLPTVAQLFAANGLNPRDYEGQYSKTFGNVRTAVKDQDLMTPQNGHKVTGATLDFKVDLGGAELKSITAYRKSTSGNQNDLDGSPLDLISFYSEYGHHQFSQELQLSGDIGKLNLIGGVYHFEEGGYEFSHAHTFGAFIQSFPPAAYASIPFDYRNTYSEYAGTSDGAFIQGNYELTDKLNLTAGYRYTRDTRDIERKPQANYIAQPGKPISCGLTGNELGNPSLTSAQAQATPLRNCNVREDASFGYPAYVISLDYQVDDNTFVYAKHSRASMAGSLNTREVPPPFSFSVKPETVTDYEIGAKSEFFDNRLRANVAAFYLEGEQVQRIINAFNSAGTGLTQFNTNTGDTEIKGLELELTALLWDGFELNFSSSWMEGKYVSGSFNETRGTVANPIIVDRSDEELPRLPKFSYGIGASQVFNLEAGELRAVVDYAYVDDQAIVTATGTPGDAAGIAAAQYVSKNASIEGYGLLNARLSFTLPNPNVEFSIWGRNLGDEEYATNVFESWSALGFLLHNQGNPRTYGASVDYRF